MGCGFSVNAFTFSLAQLHTPFYSPSFVQNHGSLV
jgi:hypothetical protein